MTEQTAVRVLAKSYGEKHIHNENIFVFFVTAAQYNRYQKRRKYEKASKDKVWTD